MKKTVLVLLFSAVALSGCKCSYSGSSSSGDSGNTGNDKNDGTKQNDDDVEVIKLPDPDTTGGMPLETALKLRKSVRSWNGQSLTMDQISQLFWAAQGITHSGNRKTAPSAGAKYPIEIYAATHELLYHYLPDNHEAATVSKGDIAGRLKPTAQDFIASAPVVFVITGVYARTEEKYGGRAQRYVRLEAGHVAQNILLQAVTLDLGAVPVGAFNDEDVKKVLGLEKDHEPLYLIPVGFPSD